MTDPRPFDGLIRAPEFPPDLPWLNTNQPLQLRDFRGKFVLLDFWTYCCINCLHVLAELARLEARYATELVVIGVHSAKFAAERSTAHIRQAVLRYGIQHPVVNDHEFTIWQSYAIRAWPTLVLINPHGRIIAQIAGENIFEPFDELLSEAIPLYAQRGELVEQAFSWPGEAQQASTTVLSYPGKISADPVHRHLCVSDSSHHRLLLIQADGEVLESIGSGAPGLQDGSFATARFSRPQGTVFLGHMLYIADTGNHAVRAANLRTREVTTLMATGSTPSSPWDITAREGLLFVAMAGPHQLWVLDPRTGDATPFAGSGREGLLDGPLPLAGLAQPSGIATDSQLLYFVDSESSAVRQAELSAAGNVTTLIGEGLFDFGDHDGPRSRARLQHPLGICYHEGLLYVADTYNHKIKIVDPRRGICTAVAGNGTAGLTDGPSPAAEFYEPGGLCFLDTLLYVADTNNHQIRVVDPVAGAVRTLLLKALSRLSPHLTTRPLLLPVQEVRPGALVLNIGVALPPGYHLAPASTVEWQWESSDPQVLPLPEAPAGTAVSLPIQTALGESRLAVSAVVYYCADDQPVCFLDRFTATTLVVVVPHGSDSIDIAIPVPEATLAG